MKKQNYIYSIAGIVLFTLWCIDLLSFFTIADIWYWIKGGYIFLSPFVWGACFFEAIPTEENKNTRKVCSICGNRITKNEYSLHYVPTKEEDNTIDYCEKCKSKVIDKLG